MIKIIKYIFKLNGSCRHMKQFHNVEVSMFVRQNEDLSELMLLFEQVFPFPVKELLKTEKVSGFEQEIITVVKVKIMQHAKILEFLLHLFQGMTEDQFRLIRTQVESRLDDDGYFYIRISKNGVKFGKHKLTETGDCIHIKILTAAFPKNRENAMKVIQTYLDSLLEETTKQL